MVCSSAVTPRCGPVAPPPDGGASVDPRHPRVTLLAQDKQGWAALCRLVSATHLRGERGKPVSTLDLVAEHTALAAANGGGLLLLLGPGSEVGRALTARRPDLARTVLARWSEVVAREDLLLEVVCHRGPDDQARAARMLGFAGDEQVTPVLSNAVRYADRSDGPTTDVLDAARRLVALDARHIDRVNAEGYLKSGKEMALVAEEVTRAAGLGEAAMRRLLATTRRVADRCAVDPRADLGIGEVHFPELAVLDSSGRPPAVVLRERCEAGLGRRAMPATREVRGRLDDELGVIEQLGFPSYFLTVADVVELIRSMDVRVAARGSGAGSLVNYLLGISGVDPIRHDLLMERFLSPLREALPDIDIDVESDRRTEIYERILERFGGERVACVSMMDTYRVRHAIRDVGAALGMPPGEIDTIAKAFPHIRARDARLALSELPELRASRLGRGPARPAVPDGRAPRRAAAPHRAAPVRRAAVRHHPARPHPGRGELAGLPDEPVRQGRRRGARPAQARRARHPHAVGDGLRRAGGACGSTAATRSTSTTSSRCRSTTPTPSR